MFRGKYRAGLQQLFQDGQLEFHGQLQPLRAPAAFGQLVRQAARKKWDVYAKRPFAGPEVVLAYLARYTHRVGITNHRILALDKTAGTVRFAYKDYADHCRAKTLTIACTEFVRRLQLHLLPERFVKIRHYGLLANRNRRTRIAAARAALPPAPEPAAALPVADAPEAAPATEAPTGLPACCPHCHQKADWVLVERVAPQHQRAQLRRAVQRFLIVNPAVSIPPLRTLAVATSPAQALLCSRRLRLPSPTSRRPVSRAPSAAHCPEKRVAVAPHDPSPRDRSVRHPGPGLLSPVGIRPRVSAFVQRWCMRHGRPRLTVIRESPISATTHTPLSLGRGRRHLLRRPGARACWRCPAALPR